MSEELKTADQPLARERKRTYQAIAVVVLLAAAVAGVRWLADSGERNARDACATYVKGKIRNPTLAEFSFSLGMQKGEGWELSGTADSDRRYSFSCTVVPGEAVTGSVY